MDKHVGAGKLKVVVVDRETGLNKTYSTIVIDQQLYENDSP